MDAWTGTKDDLASRLAARHHHEQWPALALEQMAAVFVEAGGEPLPVKSPSGGLSVLVRRYAVRSDDVKLFDCVVNALTAAAGAGFFLDRGPVAGAMTAIGVAVIRFLWQLRSNGVVLDEDRLRVLTILCANVGGPSDSGLTAEEILGVVRRLTPERDLAWVEAQLASLAQCPVPSGATRALVSKDYQNRWRPHV